MYDVCSFFDDLFDGKAVCPEPMPMVTVPTKAAAEPVSDMDIITDAEPDETIEPPPACPKCDGYELWESASLIGPSVWRCLKCDPPIKARRLLDRLAAMKRKKPMERKTAL